MNVTLSQFKTRIDEFVEMIDKEEIDITRDGRIIARLAPPPKDKLAILESLCGILPPTANEKEARQERLAKHEIDL